MHVTLISYSRDLLSYGVRMLSACLKQQEHTVRLVFFTYGYQTPLSETVLTDLMHVVHGSDVVGMSVMTNHFHNAVHVTRQIKQACRATVVWGGVHPSIRPEECLTHADAVCIGEGEEAFPEFVNRLAQGQDVTDVRGIWVKYDNDIRRNPLRPLIQDLDTLPFPDYTHHDDYLWNDGAFHPIDPEVFRQYYGDAYWAMATRGCPLGCSYCVNNTLNRLYPGQKVLRRRSIPSLMAELITMKASLPDIAHIRFEDDAFLSYPLPELQEFSTTYRTHIALPLCVTGLSPLYYTREKLDLLVAAGLQVARIGIQSGSDQTRALYGRCEQNDQILTIANDMARHRLWIFYDLILDNPWERDEDLVATLMLLTQLPTPCFLLLYSLTFFPETRLYARARQEQLITDNGNEVYRKSYFGLNNTYLNKLFILTALSAAFNIRISATVMAFLTNRTLRRLGVSQMGYYGCRIVIALRLLSIFIQVHGFGDGLPRWLSVLRMRSKNNRLTMPLFDFSIHAVNGPQSLEYASFFHAQRRYWTKNM